mmetsp:Transcript_6461/g.16514  ORF Transcript_6461/g.16514 Transcript_6461/m.16514 type:complete len:239 (+) Transcript_6461:2860-3576(+)
MGLHGAGQDKRGILHVSRNGRGEVGARGGSHGAVLGRSAHDALAGGDGRNSHLRHWHPAVFRRDSLHTSAPAHRARPHRRPAPVLARPEGGRATLRVSVPPLRGSVPLVGADVFLPKARADRHPGVLLATPGPVLAHHDRDTPWDVGRASRQALRPRGTRRHGVGGVLERVPDTLFGLSVLLGSSDAWRRPHRAMVHGVADHRGVRHYRGVRRLRLVSVRVEGARKLAVWLLRLVWTF